jgi:membrane associated rhomboid family serine protease
MIPIGDDDVRGAGPPVVTWLLIVVNVLAFLFELTLSPPELEQFFLTFGVVPAQIQQGDNLLALLTSMFLHGGWLHIVSNMLFLWVFGNNIEAVLGKTLYLLFYLAGGLAASVIHIIFNLGSNIPSVGASGAIAAVLGAYIVLFPRSQVRVLVISLYMGVTRVAAIVFLGFWFITQLFTGVASLGAQTAQTGGVAFWAHIGGFVFGVLIAVLMRGQTQRVRYS